MLSLLTCLSSTVQHNSSVDHSNRDRCLNLEQFHLSPMNIGTSIQRNSNSTDKLINQHQCVLDQLDQHITRSRGEQKMSEAMKQSTRYMDSGDSVYKSCLNLIVLLVLLLFVTITPVVTADEPSLSLHTPPGKLVPIGTHRLHIYCKGSGSPTIMIDSGMGSFSMEWKKLQDTLSNNVKTCLYDRAGYGWSDMGPFPRTTKQISDELYFLIQSAELAGPFVLVGHSFGGYTMQYFASEHPDMVAGLVLVDSSHADQFQRMDLKQIEINVDPGKKVVRQTISWPVLHQKYPDEVKRLALQMLTRSRSHATRLNEQYHFRESADQVSKINHFIPDVPLIVITRGKRVWPAGEFGDRQENAWEEMQAELSYLSTLSLQIVAKNSGHSIHLDQPELVGSVILNTVSAARKIAANHNDQFALTDSMNPTWQTDTLLEYYFDYTMSGAYVYQPNNTLYYDPTAYAVNYH